MPSLLRAPHTLRTPAVHRTRIVRCLTFWFTHLHTRILRVYWIVATHLLSHICSFCTRHRVTVLHVDSTAPTHSPHHVRSVDVHIVTRLPRCRCYTHTTPLLIVMLIYTTHVTFTLHAPTTRTPPHSVHSRYVLLCLPLIYVRSFWFWLFTHVYGYVPAFTLRTVPFWTTFTVTFLTTTPHHARCCSVHDWLRSTCLDFAGFDYALPRCYRLHTTVDFVFVRLRSLPARFTFSLPLRLRTRILPVLLRLFVLPRFVPVSRFTRTYLLQFLPFWFTQSTALRLGSVAATTVTVISWIRFPGCWFVTWFPRHYTTVLPDTTLRLPPPHLPLRLILPRLPHTHTCYRIPHAPHHTPPHTAATCTHYASPLHTHVVAPPLPLVPLPDLSYDFG